ncbi:MAG TPA: hypothetical protein VMD29_00985 [Terracidiphilus sp.]|nr:hypothetical protein [Terracidiphilus sp.]
MKRENAQSRQATESTALRTVVAIVGAYALNAALVLLEKAWLARISHGNAYYAKDLGLQCLIEVAAGFLCCIVARRGMKQVVMAWVIGLGLIVGTFSLVLSWNTEPHWYAGSLLAVWAPCIWVGYRLGLRLDPVAGPER